MHSNHVSLPRGTDICGDSGVSTTEGDTAVTTKSMASKTGARGGNSAPAMRHDRSVSKALLVTTSFLPGRGGIESYLAELCNELAPQLAVLAPATRDGKPIPDLPYPTV